MVIERSRKLRSEPDGDYYIHPHHGKHGITVKYLRPLGVLDQGKAVPSSEYGSRSGRKPMLVYPVNFKRAEECLKGLDGLVKPTPGGRIKGIITPEQYKKLIDKQGRL